MQRSVTGTSPLPEPLRRGIAQQGSVAVGRRGGGGVRPARLSGHKTPKGRHRTPKGGAVCCGEGGGGGRREEDQDGQWWGKTLHSGWLRMEQGGGRGLGGADQNQIKAKPCPPHPVPLHAPHSGHMHLFNVTSVADTMSHLIDCVSQASWSTYHPAPHANVITAILCFRFTGWAKGAKQQEAYNDRPKRHCFRACPWPLYTPL